MSLSTRDILILGGVAGVAYVLYKKSRQTARPPVFLGPATPVLPAPISTTQALPGLLQPFPVFASPAPAAAPASSGAGVTDALTSAATSIGQAFSSLFGGASAPAPAPATPALPAGVTQAAGTVGGAISSALSSLFPTPQSGLGTLPHRGRRLTYY